jgi:hypothetical protein
MATRWTLENALPIVRAMASIARRCNFSLALRGSVLTKGESDSDLDLCFLCEEPEDPAFCSVERVLREITQEMPHDIHHYGSLHGGTRPYTVIWLRDGRHIDAHFWLK